MPAELYPYHHSGGRQTPYRQRPFAHKVIAAIILLIIAATIGFFLLSHLSCAPIQPGSDPVLVYAERTYSTSFDLVDNFLKYDDENRDTLRTNAPAVHNTAEMLRREYPRARQIAKDAIAAYNKDPSQPNASALDNAMAEIERLTRIAREAFTQTRTPATPQPRSP